MNKHTWTPGIENILNSIRLNSLNLSELYKKRYVKMKGMLRFFKIPILILSSCNSVLSVGSDAFYLPNEYVSIIVCVLSLLCGIIGSIELFLSIQKQMESDLEASKGFYILSITIFKTLSIETANRNGEPKLFMEEVFSEYKKLIENSNIIEKKILDQLIDMQQYIANNKPDNYLSLEPIKNENVNFITNHHNSEEIINEDIENSKTSTL